MTKRVIGTLLVLIALGVVLALWGSPVVAQIPIGAVRIMDGVHNQLATVNHTGQLLVSASIDNIGHTSSVTHIAAAGGGLVIRDPINANARARVDHTGALVTTATVTTDNVNVFHQSTIRHVSSVTHIEAAGGGLVIRDPINPNARARVDHTGALVTSASVTTTVDNVNVFHQSTIRHISSVTHIGGFIGIRDGLCLTCWARVDHTGALVTSASVTTTVDNVNVFHQSTVRHISSLTHVVIVDWQRWAHVQVSQSGAWIATVHATGAFAVSAGQSGAWTVQAAHQGGEWNVRHVTSVLHVAIIQGASGGASHLLVAPVYQGGTWTVQPGNTANTTAWLTRNVAGQSGSWTIQAAHQGGEWNVRHISSVTHVAGFIGIRDGLCLTCWARVDHTGALVTSASVTTTVDNVNVFHQSTVRHVSSVTHVAIVQGTAGGASHLLVAPVYQAGAWNVSAAQSGAWTVQAAHQGGEWTIRHITSVVHVVIQQNNTGTGASHLLTSTTLVNSLAPRITVAHVTSLTHVSGLVSVRDDNCLTCRMRIDHYNVLVTQPHISGALRTWQVSQCGTTASLAINTNANRRDLWVMNRGNGNIYVGYGVTGHVALTTANGWPLHATASAITTTARHSTALSTVYLQNYQGPLACIADLAGQTLQVMEVLR